MDSRLLVSVVSCLELGRWNRSALIRAAEPAYRGGAILLPMFIVDAANVIGSRPTGWWRDRPGASRRFVENVRAGVRGGRLELPVVVVLEGQARQGAEEMDADGVEVVHAPAEGDDTIVSIATAHRGVVVVTADRALAERVRAVEAEVLGPRWLLDQLGGLTGSC